VIIGSPEELRNQITDVPVLEIHMDEVNQKIIETVEAFVQVYDVSVDPTASKLLMKIEDSDLTTPHIVRSIVHAGGLIKSVNIIQPSLEEAYLRLIEEDGG
jgi:hypothetical protein